MMTWQDLESHVRTIASYLYDAPANPETINAVKCDCVVKKRPDYWVVIEVTKENTLDKLRTDLAKFASVKPFLLSQNIYAECIFVCEDQPAPSLIETGNGDNVEVVSALQFNKKLLDYGAYHHARSSRAFGSAIDPFSGEKDEHAYIAVSYDGVTVRNKDYSLNDIVRLLKQNHRIVLLGNYGTGKSRCIQELFGLMAPTEVHAKPVLSIDLRDNWGVSNAEELIRRHLGDLGLSHSADNVLKILRSDSIIFLIDGFDEISSQIWSDDASVLRDIRRKSLAAVKDVVTKSHGGILVSGREHYFNSEKEMFECLGLSHESSIVIRCREEFTVGEMTSYFRELSDDEDLLLPTWLPKRPLVCQVLNTLGRDTQNEVVMSDAGEIPFWYTLLHAICDREARINPVLDAAVVQSVLVGLARITRVKSGDRGPLSIPEINQCFQEVTGSPPADESAAMLQRVPLLGRINTESRDRQFVDDYFLDGLRAEQVNRAVYSQNNSLLEEPWLNTLQPFGLRVLRAEIEASPDQSVFIKFMRGAARGRNRILAGEIASALLDAKIGDFDFENLLLSGGHITNLNLADSTARNLTIDQFIIDWLDISNSRVENLTIRKSVIGKVEGVSDAKGLPGWMKHDNDVESFRPVSTLSRIKNAPLSVHQRILVTIIKKTFFQPGSGRKEEALTRGLGRSVERKAVNKILNMLVDGEILSKVRGKQGFVYAPNRTHTKRMGEILTQLTLSDDPLWRSLPPS